MTTTMVNTVTGPVSPDDLGITLMHEHVVFAYPGWYGDCTLAPYDHDAALNDALKTMAEIKAYGVKTFVDPTPNETGRNPELLKKYLKSPVSILFAPPDFIMRKWAHRPILNSEVRSAMPRKRYMRCSCAKLPWHRKNRYKSRCH